ncbi:MAG: protein kinase [Phycisphaerales bacterium]|nr:protein kinase [Phycisphaerales bacterium]
MPPATVAHYVVERELGRGAMGVVLLAHDTKLGRQVAIKSLPDSFIHNEARRQRFERESRILATINHPNVAAIYGLEEEQGQAFLILELAEGRTLTERLHDPAPPALDETLWIMRQIAAGLDAAHGHGIVHRDLKPDNVKVRPDGVVKILDFGIAHAGLQQTLGADHDSATIVAPPPETTPGAVLGTPGYMSPEQVRGQHAGPPADTWAFGCVLFECLAGRPPFDGPTQADLFAATLVAEPQWSHLPPSTPGQVVELIRRCLRKQPDERPDRIATVGGELERVLTALRVSPASLAAPVAPARPPRPLPAATPLVGRQTDAAHLLAMLGSARVVTILGPHGVGKTALAIAAAGQAAGFTACWCPLAPIPDPAYVRGAIARALGGADGAAPPALIADRPVLLVLDGVQHAAGTCAAVAAEIAAACPNGRVLCTGLSPLGVRGEGVHALGPLAAPSPDEDGARFEAAALFLTRARAAVPGFAPDAEDAARIAALCRLFRGVPLAVELAAGALPLLPVAKMHERLFQRARLLGHAPIFEQIVDLAVEWRFDLLSAPERGVVKRLSVFPGGATLRALAAVCGADDSMPDPRDDSPFGPPPTVTERRFHEVLGGLVRASMVREEAGPRWSLATPIAQFAAARLAAAGETPAASARFAAYFRALREQATPRLGGPTGDAWRSRLDDEFANVYEPRA